MPAPQEDFAASTPDLGPAPWNAHTWDDIEEELATVAPTVRVQWNAARAKIQMEKRRFRPSRSPWQRTLAPPGITPLQNKVNWAAYGKPRSLITLFDRPWSPPDSTRDENAATPWNVKAPRLSPRVAAAKFDFVEEGCEDTGRSRKLDADDVALKMEEPTGAAQDTKLGKRKHAN